MRQVVITGGTGYLGKPLIQQLTARGHGVTTLARAESRSRVPAGATIVEGSALEAADVSRAIAPGCTLVLLVGTPRPSPAKAQQFQDVDLASVRAAADAVRHAPVAHVVYVSVAHPAPIMKAYIDVRSEGERLLTETGIPLTVLRPWYVLGPGHWWPYLLVPVYWLFELIPSKRESARRLGLVTHAQLLATLLRAIEAPPPSGTRIIEVPDIRRES